MCMCWIMIPILCAWKVLWKSSYMAEDHALEKQESNMLPCHVADPRVEKGSICSTLKLRKMAIEAVGVEHVHLLSTIKSGQSSLSKSF